MRGTRSSSMLLAGMTVLALVGMLTLAGLVIADWREARSWRATPVSQVAYAVNHGDHLHYVVHLAVGRVADLCSCAPGLAQAQYARAAWHVRTERQVGLITTERPTTWGDRAVDLLGILGSGVRWAAAAGTWAVRRAA